MLSKSARDSDMLWFEHLSHVSNPSLLLFCFPYAGAGSHVFHDWQRHFPAEIDICLVHLPGRGKRIGEMPFTHLKPLIEAIADAIHGKLQQRFALFGHSMGALISFELSRELRRRRGITPLQLFLSGRGAPHVATSDPPTYDLPHDEFITEIRRLNGTPRELLDNREMQNLFLPVLRADFEMVDTYQYVPEEPLACPLSVYGGIQDADVPVGNLQAWEEQTSGRCMVRMFPGDHFFIHGPATGFVNVLKRDVLSALGNFVRGV